MQTCGVSEHRCPMALVEKAEAGQGPVEGFDPPFVRRAERVLDAILGAGAGRRFIAQIASCYLPLEARGPDVLLNVTRFDTTVVLEFRATSARVEMTPEEAVELACGIVEQAKILRARGQATGA